MASIRTTRILAAAAAVPLAAALFTGVAQADNGSFAGGFSNAGSQSQGSVNVGGLTQQTQQQNVGAGNVNTSNSAAGYGVTQVNFTPLF